MRTTYKLLQQGYTASVHHPCCHLPSPAQRSPMHPHAQVLLENNVAFGVKRQTLEGMVGKLAGTMLTLWLPLLPLFFVLKRAVDAQSGKNKKQKQSFEPPDTTFQDVAGVDAVKEELQEAVACLRDPAKFEKLHAHMPSGVLLSGPPGTGAPPWPVLARALPAAPGSMPAFACVLLALCSMCN